MTPRARIGAGWAWPALAIIIAPGCGGGRTTLYPGRDGGNEVLRDTNVVVDAPTAPEAPPRDAPVVDAAADLRDAAPDLRDAAPDLRDATPDIVPDLPPDAPPEVAPPEPDRWAQAAVLVASCNPLMPNPNTVTNVLWKLYTVVDGKGTPRPELVDCLLKYRSGCRAMFQCLAIDLVGTSCAAPGTTTVNGSFREICDEKARLVRVEPNRLKLAWDGGRGPACSGLGLSSAAGACQGPGATCLTEIPSIDLDIASVDGTYAAHGLDVYRGEGDACEGGTLRACVGGRLADVSCPGLGSGFNCQLRSQPRTVAYCGLGDACDPVGTTGDVCDGDTVVLCNAGRIDRIDCKRLGFKTCDEGRCRGSICPWLLPDEGAPCLTEDLYCAYGAGADGCDRSATCHRGIVGHASDLPLKRALAACLALWGAACDGSDGTETWRPPADARNYRVVARLATDSEDSGYLPESFVLNLHASVSASRLVLWSGATTAAPPMAVSGHTLTAMGPLSLDVPGWPTKLTIEITSLSVEVTRDGVQGRVEGTAHLGATAKPARAIAVTGTLTGLPDDARPYLTGPPPSAFVHPVDPISLHASQPLAPDVAFDLVAADGERVPLASRPPPELTGPEFSDPGLVDRFQSTSVLRFAQRYHLEARTPIRDLTGRAAALTPLSVETITEPDVLTDGGFEEPVSAVLEGALIRDWQPVISGRRSLQLHGWPPDSRARFTARMKVPAGATNLRFAWRALAEGTEVPFPLVASVVLAWPGARPVPTVFPPIDGSYDYRASPIEVAVVPLPPEAPEELWIVIERQPTQFELGRSYPDLQIDDLVLE